MCCQHMPIMFHQLRLRLRFSLMGYFLALAFLCLGLALTSRQQIRLMSIGHPHSGFTHHPAKPIAPGRAVPPAGNHENF